MFDPSEYTVLVKRVDLDGERLFKATVLELPDVESYAESFQEAYDLAIDAIETLYELAHEDGRAFPEPKEAQEEYSGRVTLRMPKSLHRTISRIADAEELV